MSYFSDLGFDLGDGLSFDSVDPLYLYANESDSSMNARSDVLTGPLRSTNGVDSDFDYDAMFVLGKGKKRIDLHNNPSGKIYREKAAPLEELVPPESNEPVFLSQVPAESQALIIEDDIPASLLMASSSEPESLPSSDLQIDTKSVKVFSSLVSAEFQNDHVSGIPS